MDQTLSALKATSRTASLSFKGHFCLKTDVFKSSLETECGLFQYTTSIYRGSKHIIWFSPSLYPITDERQDRLVNVWFQNTLQSFF